MVELKGFTTVEAMISSVLILLSLTGASVIFLNVMSSGSSLIEFEARSKLFELAQNADLPEEDILYDAYTVSIEILPYRSRGDLRLIQLTAYDSQQHELTSLRLIRRTGK